MQSALSTIVIMKAFVNILVALITAFVILGCGDPAAIQKETPQSSISPPAGQAVVFGNILDPRNQCTRQRVAILHIINQVNNQVFHDTIPINSAYQVTLEPGTYTLTVESSPCIFSGAFTLSSNQALALDAILSSAGP